jgi:hypothetical protein
MIRLSVLCVILATLAACSSQDSEPPNAVESSNEIAIEPTNQAVETIQPGEPGGLPDDRNLVEEGPIDPKSAQGAAQVLQSYAALLEQGRFGDAGRLWSESDAATELTKAYPKYSEIHAEIGAPGAMEGAAGSSYVDLPIRLYGKLKSGGSFNSVGTATLRRVNDVPGSTEEQRQWRIYRLDVKPPL